ncbi:hypothetical protein H9P43_002288 [Blastocladiella emersonii ATCC 22665]|nr:hypothetical protein H9P43_002288 [Blastocladiella emersonii ATCC 22665]
MDAPPQSPGRTLAAAAASAAPDVQAALADYEIGHVLGKGKFSQVYLATSRSTGRKFAFKVLSKLDHRPRVMAKLKREIDILNALRGAKVFVPCDSALDATTAAADASDATYTESEDDDGTGFSTYGSRSTLAGSGSGGYRSNRSGTRLPAAAANVDRRHRHLHGGTSSSSQTTLSGHPNIVDMFQTFETPSVTIMVLQLLSGVNLHDFVFESIRLSESVARGMFRQLASAVSFCHARGVVHRDLKMGNVMLILAQPPPPPNDLVLPSSPMSDVTPAPLGPASPRRGSEPAVVQMSPARIASGRSPATPRHWPRRLELTRSYRLKFRSAIVADPLGEDRYPVPRDPCTGRPWMQQEIDECGGWLVKLVDFGLGSAFDPQEYRHTAVGSPGYFSPEVAQGVSYVGPEVDVWSLGVVLFEMTTGMHPFSAKDLPTLKEIVIRGRFAIPHHVSPDLRRTYTRLMNVDPARRRNLHVLDVDRWTNDGYATSPAYADPPEEDLAGDVDAAQIDEIAASIPIEDESFGPTTAARRRRSASAHALVAAFADAANYGRPRANTARTAASAPDGTAVWSDGDDPAADLRGRHATTEEDEAAAAEMAYARDLARRLRRFNASVPAHLGGAPPRGYHGVPPSPRRAPAALASAPASTTAHSPPAVLRPAHTRSRSKHRPTALQVVAEPAAPALSTSPTSPTGPQARTTPPPSISAGSAHPPPFPPATPRRGSAPAVHSVEPVATAPGTGHQHHASAAAVAARVFAQVPPPPDTPPTHLRGASVATATGATLAGSTAPPPPPVAAPAPLRMRNTKKSSRLDCTSGAVAAATAGTSKWGGWWPWGSNTQHHQDAAAQQQNRRPSAESTASTSSGGSTAVGDVSTVSLDDHHSGKRTGSVSTASTAAATALTSSVSASTAAAPIPPVPRKTRWYNRLFSVSGPSASSSSGAKSAGRAAR